MQTASTNDQPHTFPAGSPHLRNLSWFLTIPIVVGVVLSLAVALTVAIYQGRHTGRVFTGVSMWGVDLSGMDRDEVSAIVATFLPDTTSDIITLVDPDTGREYTYTPAELGFYVDAAQTVDAALGVGRQGGPWTAFRDQFDSWYHGRALAPVIVFDEGRFATALDALAQEIGQPAADAALVSENGSFVYQSGTPGRVLDLDDTRRRLLNPLLDFRQTQLELLVHNVMPQVPEDSQAAAQLGYLLEPMTLYFQEPLDDTDITPIVATSEQLSDWLRVEMVTGDDGQSRYHTFIDENAVRAWLNEIEAQVYRPPKNARFYFDDDTRELVLVEPHVNGRSLDVSATLQQFMAQVDTPNRSVPLMLKPILPTVHANATAQELGITELITQTTTWFYGSTPERKHNIARAAAQFFGIVIAPGEEFSFNRYLGDVTEEAGFSTGLIILGGRTIEGVGGGVCQVSTTLYQAAFWAGFPITTRLEHGYRVHYYDDGEGPGMDATVFSPLVDFRFVNNTDHYLLLENYYNEQYEALTFKLYSTSTGRRVVKEEPIFENVLPPNPDVWEFNPDLAEGEIKQVDWAVEGADVTVVRRVYDANGNLMYGTEYFISHYIPWQNIYQYGPGVEPPPPPVPTVPPPTATPPADAPPADGYVQDRTAFLRCPIS